MVAVNWNLLPSAHTRDLNKKHTHKIGPKTEMVDQSSSPTWSPGLREPLHLHSQTHKCAQVTATAVRTCPARGIMGRRWAVFVLPSPGLDLHPRHHYHTLCDHTRFQRKSSISAQSSPGLDTCPPPSLRDLHLITQFMPGPGRAEAPAQASPHTSKGEWDSHGGLCRATGASL